MFKKLILAGMAIAAFAAFAAAPASAATITEGGVPIPAGSLVTFTSTETPTFTGAFNVTCSKGSITAKVTRNNDKIEGTATAAQVVYTGTGTGGDCTSALGSTKVIVNSELCLVSGETDNFTITGCEGKAVQFTLEVTGTGPCKYSTAAVAGTFTTGTTPATVNVTEQEAKKIEGGFFCPASGKLDQDFDLYTDNPPTETPLTIS